MIGVNKIKAQIEEPMKVATMIGVAAFILAGLALIVAVNNGRK